MTNIDSDLRSSLLRLKSTLEQVGERACLPRISLVLDSDPIALLEVLSWFGGMGSLNDLWISAANGHRVTELNRRDANVELDRLRRAVHDAALTLARYQPRTPA